MIFPDVAKEIESVNSISMKRNLSMHDKRNAMRPDGIFNSGGIASSSQLSLSFANVIVLTLINFPCHRHFPSEELRVRTGPAREPTRRTFDERQKELMKEPVRQLSVERKGERYEGRRVPPVHRDFHDRAHHEMAGIMLPRIKLLCDRSAFTLKKFPQRQDLQEIQ